MGKIPLSKEKKVKLLEEAEKLLEMGQESDTKAAKSVIELSNQAEKKDKAEEDTVLEDLTSKRRFNSLPYKESIATYMKELLKEEGIPRGYHYMIQVLEKGIGLAVCNEKGTLKAARKLKIVGEPKYDKHAAMLFAYWAGDIIYRDVKKSKETFFSKNGIIL